MSDLKTTTLRLSPLLFDEVRFVADVDGVPMAEVVRRAVEEHVRARRDDPAFRAAAFAHLERLRKTGEALGEPSP